MILLTQIASKPEKKGKQSVMQLLCTALKMKLDIGGTENRAAVFLLLCSAPTEDRGGWDQSR